MKSDRWQRVQEVYFKALELPEVHRTPFLDSACDPEMRKEIESLLQCEGKIEKFLEPSTVNAAAAAVKRALSPESENSDAFIGRVIDDRYVITQHLGSGGMGDVYRADHNLMRTPVAIKRLGSRFRDRPEYRKRAVEEGRRAILLDHENLARVKDVVEES